MTNGVLYRAPDYAKAIGIHLVVVGHVLRGLDSAGILVKTPFWQAVDDGIYLFHMPLFFYLAGLFFRQTVKAKDMGYVARRYAEILLLPLIIWSYIQLSLQYAAGGFSNNQLALSEVLLAPFPPKQQFWFLGTLFVITISCAALLKSRGDKAALAFFVVLFAPYALLWPQYDYLLHHNVWTFLFAQTLIHAPFFLLGILLDAERMRKLRVHWLGSVTIFAASISFYLLWPAGPVHALASVAAVLALYAFMVDMDARRTATESVFSKWTAFVGMNSMIVYLSHIIFAAGVRSVLIKLGVDNAGTHFISGIAAGMIFPLMLVPLGMLTRGRFPLLTKALLPVRLERK